MKTAPRLIISNYAVYNYSSIMSSMESRKEMKLCIMPSSNFSAVLQRLIYLVAQASNVSYAFFPKFLQELERQ